MNPGKLSELIRLERKTTTRGPMGSTDVWNPVAEYDCAVAEVSAQVALVWAQRNVIVTHQILMRGEIDIFFKTDRAVWLGIGQNKVLQPIQDALYKRGILNPVVTILVEQLQQTVE